MTEEKKISEYLEVLSSKAPVPGGGGASALAGALGNALGQMVVNLTVGKKKYAEVEEEMQKYLTDLNIQLYLCFFLRFCFEVLNLLWVHARQIIQRLDAKSAQEFFCRTKQTWLSRHIHPANLTDQIILHKAVHCVVRLHTTDLLNLKLCYRLFVCNNRKCL